MTYKDILSSRLKEIRKELDVTQSAVASFANVSVSNISKFENGQLEPNINTLCKLADYYAVTTDWLLGRGMRSEKHTA